MRRNIFMIVWALALLLGAELEAHGQRRLSQMPKAEREALLVKWAKEEQKTSPHLEGFRLEADSVVISQHLFAPEDSTKTAGLYYNVYLYNKAAYRAGTYDWGYVCHICFGDETGATYCIADGNGWMITPEPKPRYSVLKRKKQKDSREDRKKTLD